MPQAQLLVAAERLSRSKPVVWSYCRAKILCWQVEDRRIVSLSEGGAQICSGDAGSRQFFVTEAGEFIFRCGMWHMCSLPAGAVTEILVALSVLSGACGSNL